MPTSLPNHISYVIEKGTFFNPKSVLDIGVGNGKWGYLFREYLDIYGKGDIWRKQDWKVQIDGIEIYAPYVDENPCLKRIYNNVYIGDACDIFPALGNYDLVIFGDILEHVQKEKGAVLLNQILEKSKMLILSVPLGDWRYNFKGENKAESHVSVWEEEELIKYPKYKEHKIYSITASSGREIRVGVFIFN